MKTRSRVNQNSTWLNCPKGLSICFLVHSHFRIELAFKRVMIHNLWMKTSVSLTPFLLKIWTTRLGQLVFFFHRVFCSLKSEHIEVRKSHRVLVFTPRCGNISSRLHFKLLKFEPIDTQLKLQKVLNVSDNDSWST